MPEIITCPSCQRKLALPQISPGLLARCPACQHVFQPVVEATPVLLAAPAPSVAPPDPQEDPLAFDLPAAAPAASPDLGPPAGLDFAPDPSREGLSEGQRRAWRTVHIGVLLIIISTWGMLVLAAALFLMVLGGSAFLAILQGAPAPVGPANARGEDADAVLVLMLIAFQLLLLVGMGLCLAVPLRSKLSATRPTMFSACVLFGMGLLLLYGGPVIVGVGSLRPGQVGGVCFLFLLLALFIGSWVQLIAYMRNVCMELRITRLARGLDVLLQLICWTVAVPFLTWLFGSVLIIPMRGRGPIVAMIGLGLLGIVILALVTLLVCSIIYFVQLHMVWGALGRFINPPTVYEEEDDDEGRPSPVST